MIMVAEIKECTYKDEKYLVRLDGQVYRLPKEGKRKRKLDKSWTPGSWDEKTGLYKFGTERVHLIVATAWYGSRDIKKYIIEHIDGDKKNNSPENLRWITKIQAVFDNPTHIHELLTYFPCGLQEFFNNPSLLIQRGYTAKDLKWLADVPGEELAAEYNLSKAGEEYLNIEYPINDTPFLYENNTADVFEEGENIAEFFRNSNREQIQEDSFSWNQEEEKDWKYFMTPSPTPNVLQDNWRTPTEFLLCPVVVDDNTLADYEKKLEVGVIFCKNQLWQSTVLDKAFSEDGQKLWVVLHNESGTKQWALVEIYIREDLIIHSTVSTFFSQDGAMKMFTVIQGKEWTGEDSIDDYC